MLSQSQQMPLVAFTTMGAPTDKKRIQAVLKILQDNFPEVLLAKRDVGCSSGFLLLCTGLLPRGALSKAECGLLKRIAVVVQWSALAVWRLLACA